MEERTVSSGPHGLCSSVSWFLVSRGVGNPPQSGNYSGPGIYLGEIGEEGAGRWQVYPTVLAPALNTDPGSDQ